MIKLINNDCLEELKKIEDKSIDLIFNDLPYAATSCKWDSLVDINELWKQYKRIRKDNTPIFFTCSTKFGVSLINSNPKEFRYDLVWVKSAPCGFLNAKKMPMKKHEMIYVFYKKLPLYDLSSHKHKFLKEVKDDDNLCKYDVNKNAYGGGKEGRIKISKDKKDHQQKYDPPLPTSVIRTDLYSDKNKKEKRELKREPPDKYDPPLPTSVIKDDDIEYKNSITIYGEVDIVTLKNRKDRTSQYNPPLPNSILEIKSQKGKHPTQKPDSLMEWILKYYSKEDDIILDPTMGSGSMGVSCKKMNRKFIGIEKDMDIFKIAQERIS